MGNWTLEAGREFTESELRAGSAVCLLGATVVRELFGDQDPLGSKIRLGKLACQVIGTLHSKGQSTMGTDRDDLVLIPLRTFQRRLAGNQDVRLIQVSIQKGSSTEAAEEDIKRLMRKRRHISQTEDDDFSVMDLKEITKMLTGTTQVLTALLGAVAAVSLLVGGIGIMNIMLVSVTERTREIGTRLAIGALEREVLTQFCRGSGPLVLWRRVRCLAGAPRIGPGIESAECAFRIQPRDCNRGLSFLSRSRGRFRLLSRAEGGTSRPDRGASTRMSSKRRAARHSKRRLPWRAKPQRPNGDQSPEQVGGFRVLQGS